MTNTKNGTTIALVVVVVILALFAFRSLFFFLPFGVFPGLSRSFSGIGPSFSGWFHGFGVIGRMAFLLIPLSLLVLWGAVLVWVYRDAEKRGMSGILWLLLVLIGNVIGLLIYAIVRSETPLRKPAPPAPPEQAACCPPVTCPACGKPLAPGYTFCPYCGKSLKRTCPACGKPAEEGWKVCPSCGAEIDPGATRQA
jgi:hypothetical protein